MAEGKKSFLLYCDLIHTVKKLPKEKQADLFVHILEYVNDLNPSTDDMLLEIAFEPIKQSLKRDLIKYENIVGRNRENGKKGGRPKKPKKPNGLNKNPKNPSEPKKADSVSDSDSVNDNEIKVNLYKEKEFLTDWNKLRLEHLKKPSFLKRIGNHDDKENFNELLKDYDKEEFKKAMIGLFKQQAMPNGNTTMQSNPSHFFNYFNSYLTAYHDKNRELYGKPKKETA